MSTDIFLNPSSILLDEMSSEVQGLYLIFEGSIKILEYFSFDHK